MLAGITLSVSTPALAEQGCRDGVTVVVDFAAFGAAAEARCAEGDHVNGVAALEAAGFAVTMAQSQPGFVCRIDGEPAEDPCDRTPPADAYWSYWHAVPDAPWGYATSGAVSRAPEPGTVEGWTFATPADDGPPSLSPADAAATASPPETAAEAPDVGDGPGVGLVAAAVVLAALVAASVATALRRRRER